MKENPSEAAFIQLLDELRPILKKISQKNRYLGFIDKDDLYQQAVINLWQRLKEGQLENKTSSYIVRGCYFHIQNYIRTHKVRNNILSLEEPVVSEEGIQFCLKDTLSDGKQDLVNQLNNRFIVENIMNNGLTKRENEVFRLLYAGLNLREIARKLDISHVRVVKIKQNIRHKYKEKSLDARITKT